MLKELTTALRRRLSPTLKVMYQVGYLNDSLQRTDVGVHMLLNFLEQKHEKEFLAFLKELRKEKIAESKGELEDED